MKINLIETKEILDLEKLIQHKLILNERNINQIRYSGLKKYYVYFEKSEIMKDNKLWISSGNGNTIDEALIDYANRISLKKIVFNVGLPNQEEIILPKIVHTKLLNQ
jgi:hypothetical protein